jgi:hypothetical protein
VDELPAQIVDDDALRFKLGETLTVIALEATAEHPLAFVPVTE